jgi:hypothetical protein
MDLEKDMLCKYDIFAQVNSHIRLRNLSHGMNEPVAVLAIGKEPIELTNILITLKYDDCGHWP